MKTSRLTRGIAGVAAAALAVTGAAFAVAPAAADDLVVDVNNIGPESAGYFGWHEGVSSPAPIAALWDGILVGNGGSNQILNGLVNTGEAGLPITTDALGALITGSSIWTVEGTAFTQVPVTWGTDGWATLRPAAGVATNSDVSPALSDLWMSSRDIGTTLLANTAAPLSDVLAALDAADAATGDVAYSGFGFFADTAAVVQYMEWDGDRHIFSVNPTFIEQSSTVNVTLGEIRPNEDTYPGWHEGYVNETPAFTITEDGLSLGNGANSQILNGFEPALTDANLWDQFWSAGITVVSGSAFFQVPVTFGDEGWSTLRPAAAATEGYTDWVLDDMWISSKPIGDVIAANTEYRLGDIIDALNGYENAAITGVGVLAESGAPAVVESILFNGVLYNFVPVAVTPPGTDAPAKPELAATGFEGEMGLGLAGLMLMLGLGLAGTQLVRSRRAASSK